MVEMTLEAKVARRFLMALLLALVVLAISLGQAHPSKGASKEGGAGVQLTREERAAFEEGAKKVAGLNDEQIERVLKDPELYDDIPVRRGFVSRTVDAPSTRSSRAAYAPVCRDKLTEIPYYDNNDRLVFKLTAIKNWCFDGDRVLSGNMDNVTAWIREDARYTPETGGWSYADYAQARTERFVPSAGRTYGGHQSTVAGKWELRLSSEERSSKTIRNGISQVGKYDGTCDSISYYPQAAVITSAPRALSQSKSASFTFSTPTAGTTFKCSLDGNGLADCSSPKSYSSLSEGNHTFRLNAVDAEGRAVLRPRPHVFRVDSVAPMVSSTTPSAGATGVGAGTNIVAIFSEDVEAISLLGNFTLVKAGTNTPVETAITYDPSTRKAVLNPVSNLVPGTRYTARIEGGAGGVEDRAGNLLAVDKAWTFTVS